MRFKEVVDFDGTGTELTAQLYAISGYNTPFQRGRECILAVLPSAAFDGTVEIEGDNTTDGSYADILAETDQTGIEMITLRNVTLGDNLRITTTSSSAGSCRIVLLGDS